MYEILLILKNLNKKGEINLKAGDQNKATNTQDQGGQQPGNRNVGAQGRGNENIKGKEQQVTGDGGMEDDSTSQEGSNKMNKEPKLLSLNQSMRPSFFGKGKK
jgi:hypothetical protein